MRRADDVNERRRGEESVPTGETGPPPSWAARRGPAPHPVVVTEPAGEPLAPPEVLDANQVVAYNFRSARKLRGWTQEEAARRLAPYLGQELPKASISGIERSFDGERRRLFDAQDLVAFSLAFDLPVVWFLLPPPSAAEYQLAAAGRSLALLVPLLLGRDDQLDDIKGRMEELREARPRSSGDVLAEAGGFPPELTWERFQRSREKALFALIDEEISDIERLMGDLRRVMVRFDDLSLRSHYASRPPTGLGASHD